MKPEAWLAGLSDKAADTAAQPILPFDVSPFAESGRDTGGAGALPGASGGRKSGITFPRSGWIKALEAACNEAGECAAGLAASRFALAFRFTVRANASWPVTVAPA